MRGRLAAAVITILLAACDTTAPSPGEPTAGVATPTPLDPELLWPQYHGDAGRTGYADRTPPPGQVRRAWRAKLDGAVYGQALVAHGRVLAATEADSVYALDPVTGAVVWHTKVGTPVKRSALPCGNIDPIGITSTPVYDPTTDRLFVVALIAEPAGPAHVLVVLRAADGGVLARRRVDVAGLDPAAMNQRGALALADGRVYIPYGGNDGDCGNYRGSVVAVGTDGAGPLLSWSVPTPREGGIWAAPGIAQDGAGRLFVAIGNGAIGTDGGEYDGSDSVTALTTDLTRSDFFAPARWREENDADQDLGSAGPLLVDGRVWIQGKADRGYLLDAAHLGGIGRPAHSAVGICRKQFGGAAAHNSVVFAPCTDGLRQVRVGPDGSLQPGWRAPSQVTGSPVVAGGVVWALDPKRGRLYALDENTGKPRGEWAVGRASRFASPTPAGQLMLIPTMTGITALTGA